MNDLYTTLHINYLCTTLHMNYLYTTLHMNYLYIILHINYIYTISIIGFATMENTNKILSFSPVTVPNPSILHTLQTMKV